MTQHNFLGTYRSGDEIVIYTYNHVLDFDPLAFVICEREIIPYKKVRRVK